MGSVWREIRRGDWEPTALPEPQGRPSQGVAIAGVRFLRFGSGSEQSAALLVPPGLVARVNGRPVLGGLRVLEHKDEVTLGPSRLFYSAESTPIALLFQPAEGVRLPTCPLCRGPVRAGEQAVQCPGCSRWFHQLDAKTCWTYAPTCRFCNHPTALSGDAAWRPEREDEGER